MISLLILVMTELAAKTGVRLVPVRAGVHGSGFWLSFEAYDA